MPDDEQQAAMKAAGLKPRVPLPPELSGCRCPHRPSRHYHNCQVAIAFDERPLSERPEYELGRRFEAVSFQLPNRVRGTLNIDVEIDIEGVIKANREQYRRFQPEEGWEDWEKPVAFVWENITEAWSGVWFAGPRRLVYDGSDFEYDYHSRGGQEWKAEDTERLHSWLESPANDPNQPTLDLGPALTPQPCQVTAWVALEADGGMVEVRCNRTGAHTNHNLQFQWPAEATGA